LNLGLGRLLLLGLLLQFSQPLLGLFLLGLHFFPVPHPFAHIHSTAVISAAVIGGTLIPHTFQNPGFLRLAGSFLCGQRPLGLALFLGKLIGGAGSNQAQQDNQYNKQETTDAFSIHR
jgi:hypothetical protein